MLFNLSAVFSRHQGACFLRNHLPLSAGSPLLKHKREIQFNQINDQILFSDPLELAKCYIEPHCQEINPADRLDDDFFVSKEPIFKKIEDFIKMQTFQQGNNQLFILSDAGMGKTSFLVMFKLLSLTSFWPKGYYCHLLKLNDKSIDNIQLMENKRKTVLLLDSLDEDPCAYGRIKKRLIDILDCTKNIKKVIITCRTQFFPEIDKDPLEIPGRIRIESYLCPSKYISPFDNKQIHTYLRKRFPQKYFLFNNKRYKKSKLIVESMGTLKCRPMLLSFIKDLVDSTGIMLINDEYSIYQMLVESWLLREQTKTKLDYRILMKACAQLAFEMQARKKLKIDPMTLDDIIRTIDCLETIKTIDIKGRSLLNKNSDGDYRFSHYSIQEFLVVYYVINYAKINENRSIYPTDFIKILLDKNEYQLRMRFDEEISNQQILIEANSRREGIEAKIKYKDKKKIKEIFKEYLPEIDKYEIKPFEEDLNIPTFIRQKINIPAPKVKE